MASSVIFLDIDGVLNTRNTEERTPCGSIALDNKCMKNLVKLCNKKVSDIVLTSDWKYSLEHMNADGEYLVKTFESYGLSISGYTKDDENMPNTFKGRGKGISDYLAEHKEIKYFVVIDDECFYDFSPRIKKHLVLVDPVWGLHTEDVEKADEILYLAD